MKGWIKIHRSFLDWEWWGEDGMMTLWLYLLLSANSEDKKWRGLTIHRGQFVTSLAGISERTNLSVRSVRTGLERLKTTNEVTINTTNKYSVVTICNYDKYQLGGGGERQTNDTQNDKQTTNKRQTNDKQTTTTEEHKNIRNNKKDTTNVVSKENDKAVFSPDDLRKMFEETCTSLPKVLKMTDVRKQKAKSRISEVGGADKFREILLKVEASDFLTGRTGGSRKWKASFDWIIENETNWVKVLEGRYDNSTASSNGVERGIFRNVEYKEF